MEILDQFKNVCHLDDYTDVEILKNDFLYHCFIKYAEAKRKIAQHNDEYRDRKEKTEREKYKELALSVLLQKDILNE